MTDHAQVYQFLRARRAKAYCNDCIAKETGVDVDDVAAITMDLRTRSRHEFTRWYGACSVCNDAKNVVTMAFL